MILCRLAILLGLAAAPASAQSDLERTWGAAQVWLPGMVVAVSPADIPANLGARAAVVYAHGCEGPSRITTASARFLAEQNLLVVAPDSFARRDKPQSCDPAIPLGGMHRAVLGWRHAELRFAMERLAKLPGTQDLPIVLMGHSEGGIAVATMTAPGAALRIVEGWTCHAGWPEYRGLNAPSGQPVLALVGEKDPWFRVPILSGDCGRFMPADAPMRSVVFRSPDYLAARHWLSSDRDVQRTILDFISDNLPNAKD